MFGFATVTTKERPVTTLPQAPQETDAYQKLAARVAACSTTLAGEHDTNRRLTKTVRLAREAVDNIRAKQLHGQASVAELVEARREASECDAQQRASEDRLLVLEQQQAEAETECRQWLEAANVEFEKVARPHLVDGSERFWAALEETESAARAYEHLAHYINRALSDPRNGHFGARTIPHPAMGFARFWFEDFVVADRNSKLDRFRGMMADVRSALRKTPKAW